MDATTELNTVEEVSKVIELIIEVDGVEFRTLKPAQRRIRAARLADLFEIRARYWHELNVSAHHTDTIPGVYGFACALAERSDRDSARFWRTQAGAR